ncbi:MAG: hypothetical protein ACR2QK_22295 [Acidimicrobiales bacterium]
MNFERLGYIERLGLWPARAIWLVAPLTMDPALSRALQSQASTPGLLVEIWLWLCWFVVLVAGLTPSPRSLTITRIAGPSAIGATIAAAMAETWDGRSVLAIALASLFTATVFLPTFGDRMVNGSAYGAERRMALRPPAFVLLGPAQLAWLLVFAGLAAAPLLILAERYLLAGLAAGVGAVAVWAGGRVLHQLARRWIVFVPAGFVIHDPMALFDSVLLRRKEVVALGPALADSATAGSSSDDPEGPRIDLSGGALGLALEVGLRATTLITIRARGQLHNREVSNIVFSPTLPGAMLSEARIRGLKIGEAPVGR